MIPVILCGGVGSRLWPISREAHPKQYLDLVGSKTMLQDTLRRALLVGDEAPILICNEESRFTTAEQVRQIGAQVNAIILEPEGRNTAPALALAAIQICKSDPDTLLHVMPADHIILDDEHFISATRTAAEFAKKDMLMTMGIKPTAPETGYGYIKMGEEVGSKTFEVAEFIEKPDFGRAETFLKEGNFLWNSGMFLFSASSYLRELRKYNPSILRACMKAVETSCIDLDFLRPGEEAFLDSPNMSIDYAVMEKTEKAGVTILESSWSDVGSWSALWSISDRDSDGNTIRGDVLIDNCENSYIRSESRLVTATGLKDLVLVETADAVLATTIGNSQGVKDIVNKLKLARRAEVFNHKEVFRPWGSYESLVISERFQVKRIIVKAGHALSLQKHFRRAEHWVVVSGVGEVTCGSETFNLEVDESVYIPINTKHRLRNCQSEPLEIIEVQTGDYLGEDDIERYDDDYGRDNSKQ